MALKRIIPVASLVSAVVGAGAVGGGIAGVSWGPSRIDVFGADSKSNVFHKYYTGYDWQPNDPKHGNLEIFGNAQLSSPVSVASWGADRLDFVFVDKNGNVKHKYWDGSNWAPNGMDDYDILGKDFKGGPLAINSWGPGRFDIVGLYHDGSYLHKAWTGQDYYPPGVTWESFGGQFKSNPATVSWAANRLDVFGVGQDGNLMHKFWVDNQWIPGGQDFESLGGADKGFGNSVVASSMHEGRFDVWAVSEKTGELWHKFWDGYQYQGWETLGGNFSSTPQVNHWGPNRIDILGKDATDGSYQHKFWNGYEWNDWAKKGGPFKSEPVIVNVGPNNLNFFGVDGAGNLKLQVWEGSQWLPGYNSWYDLANTSWANSIESNMAMDQKVLLKDNFDGVRIELKV